MTEHKEGKFTHSVILMWDGRLLISSKKLKDNRCLKLDLNEQCRGLSEKEIIKMIELEVKVFFWVKGNIKCELHEGVIERIREAIKNS